MANITAGGLHHHPFTDSDIATLVKNGPRVWCQIGLSETDREVRGRQGRNVAPEVFAGWVLIDTGCPISGIDESLLWGGGIHAVFKGHTKPYYSPIDSASSTVFRQFLIDMVLMRTPDEANKGARIKDVPVSGIHTINHGGKDGRVIGVIGRDLLRDGTLFYNGVEGAFTLGIDVV